MKTLKKDIIIPALKGKETIARADDVFTGWIDSDFENWGTDKKGVKTGETKFVVQEMTENSKFNQLFTKPDEMVMSQEQIIWYCTNHKDLLHEWYTFFLFKIGETFFVARVRVRDSGELDVRVDRFDDGSVWSAGGRHRVVLPKLALESLDSYPLKLSDFETLQERISELEQWRDKMIEAIDEATTPTHDTLREMTKGENEIAVRLDKYFDNQKLQEEIEEILSRGGHWSSISKDISSKIHSARKEAQMEVLERTEQEIKRRQKYNNWSHTKGSHSDDFQDREPCDCMDAEIKIKNEVYENCLAIIQSERESVNQQNI